MSWAEVGDASTSWTVTASASTSFSAQADASGTYALANVNDYVEVDYVVDFYVDDNVFASISGAANTWSEA